MKPIKVLISAYACRADEGSEPGVGWNTVKELTKYHKIWVLTRNNNRPSIEAELAKSPIPGLEFIYCDLPLSNWWRGGLQGVHLHYYLWQLKAYFIARKLHQEIKFDIVHHVTYVRYSSPSFLSLLPVPFIWGPVGGGELAPKSFEKDFSLRGKFYEIVRLLAHRIGEQDYFTRLTAQRSVLVQATTEDTAKRLYKIGAKNVRVFSESSLSNNEVDFLAKFPILDKTKVCFISMARLLHWKGLHLGICAFAQADIQNAEYWILGEGPEKQRLQTLAKKLKVEDQVKFWGKLSRDETLKKLNETDILVHPSLHDSGGWVCLEAMAAGRPVICLDTGGPAVQVTEQTGLKISPHSPEQVISELAEGMKKLAKNSELRIQMGQAGRKLIREKFTWSIKAEQLAHTYLELLN